MAFTYAYTERIMSTLNYYINKQNRNNIYCVSWQTNDKSEVQIPVFFGQQHTIDFLIRVGRRTVPQAQSKYSMTLNSNISNILAVWTKGHTSTW